MRTMVGNRIDPVKAWRDFCGTAPLAFASRRFGRSEPAGMIGELVQELQELGFTAETVALLPLVPVIEVAWADGGVTKAEREPIVALARSRGIASGSAADLQLTQWLTDQPAEAVFAGARRLIRAMLDSGSAQTGDLKADDLVKYCEEIASASGGLLGIGRISASERALLSRIAADLHARRS